MTYDPDAAATGNGVFGLPEDQPDAAVVLLPVPFDATCSYSTGTAEGPAAILEASRQVDLRDRRFGDVWQAGIRWTDPPEWIARLSAEAREHAERILPHGGPRPGDAGDEAAVAAVNAASDRVLAHVRGAVAAVLAEGRIPGLIGGEHAVSLGAMLAVCARHPGVGVLQLDAHMDLRDAFEGFAQSHASVMFNLLERAPSLGKLVQVGIRDYGSREQELAERGPRVAVWYGEDIHDRRARGEPLAAVWAGVLAALPREVYLSVDIDALEPDLCPHTGTPVPGGLRYEDVGLLLSMLVESGRRIVGFDLVEVAPGPEGFPPINEIVGARMLYRLCGAAVRSQGR